MMTNLEQALLKEVQPVAKRFIDAGYEIYLVGGIVRELMMGNEVLASGDLDLCTSARPKATKELLADFAEELWSIGERFGTIGCVFKGRVYEITTFRKESYDPTSRKPVVNFGDDVLGDLERRDFTINAMAISLPDGKLVDPHNGLEDLRLKKLKAPIDPRILFQEDPLRMLRAARFEAGLGFSPDPQIVKAMEEMAERIKIVSSERRIEEMKRLLMLPDPVSGIERLEATGLLDIVFPGYSSRLVKSLTKLPPDFNLRLALLYLEGEEEALSLLNLPKVNINVIRNLLGLAREVLSSSINSQEVRKLAANAGNPTALNEAMQLVSILDSTKSEQVLAKLEDLKKDDENPFNPTLPLTSEEIMQVLKIPPGPKINEAKILMKNAYYKKGKLTSRQATKLIKKRLR